MLRKSLRKPLVVCSLVLALVAAFVLAQWEIRAVESYVSRGEKLARGSGCYACHGASEHDPRVNFRGSASGRFRPSGIATFWENGIESGELIKEWIRDGVPADERKRHERLFIQMPAYGQRGYLTEDEIESIAAWILAKGIAMTGAMGSSDLEVPQELDPTSLSRDELIVFGDRISRQQACYQCHGEFGQGGVENPESFKGYIPGFFGSDFLELTDGGDPAEIAHWIEEGRGLAIESGLKGRLARRYFEGQAIGMPAYRALLSESEITILVEYLLALNSMGPLSVKDLESLNQTIAESVKNELNQDQE